jgi:hypothetical protein
VVLEVLLEQVELEAKVEVWQVGQSPVVVELQVVVLQVVELQVVELQVVVVELEVQGSEF